MITQIKKLIDKIFHKKKPFIRFYSLEPGVLEVFPIVPSSQLRRKFTSSPVIPGEPSSKFCPGIRKLVSTGWIVTAPADFLIKPSDDGVKFEWVEPWRFGSSAMTLRGTTYIADHGPNQVVPLLDDPSDTLKSVVKVQTPWRVEASDDIVLLQLPTTYNNESRFYSATGIFDPRYGYTVNVQLFWKKLDEETVIKAGTPLCQFIPMSRKHLASNFYDVIIDDATSDDINIEKAFVYASNCVIHSTDNLSARLDRVTKVLSKFSKRG
jgi:hypothetical protein